MHKYILKKIEISLNQVIYWEGKEKKKWAESLCELPSFPGFSDTHFIDLKSERQVLVN